MFKVRCSYDNQGRLLADNAHHPGIEAADMVEVLTGWAAMAQDERCAWRWYATGPTKGRYSFLTVVFVRDARYAPVGEMESRPRLLDATAQPELIAITAFPASARSIEEYLRLRKEEGLCIPADDTEPS